MDSLGIDTFALEWQVEAFDSTHSLESINGPHHLELAILSPPIVPFNLGSPANNQNLFLQMDNILDTLEFSWSESFNIFGDSIYYKVLFENPDDINKLINQINKEFKNIKYSFYENKFLD